MVMQNVNGKSYNEAALPFRMLDYRVQGFRTHGVFPRQILLCAGDAPLRMESGMHGDRLSFSYEPVDVRDLDGEALLGSPQGTEREVAFRQLTKLAGLRQLGGFVNEEAKAMPVLSDIMEHDLLRPAIRQGIEQGREPGLQQGRREVALSFLTRLINRRFGSVPENIAAQLQTCPTEEVRHLVDRTLDAQSVDDILVSSNVPK
jgi:hypothetical protein